MDQTMIRFFVLSLATFSMACTTDEPSMEDSSAEDVAVLAGKADSLIPDSAIPVGTLFDADARELAETIEAAGAPVGVRRISAGGTDYLMAFNVFCMGENFQDQCFVSSQDINPAVSRATIEDPTAGRVWSLLKRAGVQQFTSALSDGSAGKVVIFAGTLRCSLGGLDQCDMDGASPPAHGQ